MNNKILSVGIVVAVLLGVINLSVSLSKGGGNGGLGGTTADDWNVGGNLTVTGTSALTGAISLSSTLSVTGSTTVAKLIQGGATTTLSSAATTTTLTAAQVCNNSLIDWDAAGSSGDATLTLPSHTNLIANCLTSDGMRFDLLFRNTSTGVTTHASNTIIVAGGGIVLVGASTTAASEDVVVAGKEVVMKFWRVSATNTEVILTSLIDSD